MRNYFFIFLLATTLFSCGFSSEERIDVSAVDIEVSVSRFDIDFYNIETSTLAETKRRYPLLFPENVPDSVWVQKQQNADERELFVETQKIYADFSAVKEQLTTLFKHIKYYNPKFKAPKIITLISNVDYQSKVIYTKEVLLISLDVYLGKRHPFYDNFPKYIKQNYHKDHIVVDVADKIINTQLSVLATRTFLSKMIAAGKRLYLLDRYLPEIADEEKIGYEKQKLAWAQRNESQIWKYFIEHKLLYSTDTKLNQRFIDDAPFSKFYRSEDQLSPGRIGAWFGWQIVRSYMKHNNVSLQRLLKMEAEEIFKNSKYKPKK
ncbi:MAG: gliding motility lipoprotein GldB [Polaribacter sp.]|nr:gliding motility lipoprotein GldB [Polaribacter sp.]